MRTIDPTLEEPTFAIQRSWRRRVDAWLCRETQGGEDPFLEANVDVVRRVLADPDAGVRMVVNMPAVALLSFLGDGKYLNCHERERLGYKPPSDTRRGVEELLFGTEGFRYYYGAVELNGTGVRFYGEYTAVLRQDAVSSSTRVFDRNSYDLAVPPLSEIDDVSAAARVLKGHWGRDLVDMLTLKALPWLRGYPRLITVGSVSETVVSDEDFVEVHRRGTFGPDQIEEVRQSPADVARAEAIRARYRAGVPPSPSEIVWTSRRALVEQGLRASGTESRLITSSGRAHRGG